MQSSVLLSVTKGSFISEGDFTVGGGFTYVYVRFVCVCAYSMHVVFAITYSMCIK